MICCMQPPNFSPFSYLTFLCLPQVISRPHLTFTWFVAFCEEWYQYKVCIQRNYVNFFFWFFNRFWLIVFSPIALPHFSSMNHSSLFATGADWSKGCATRGKNRRSGSQSRLLVCFRSCVGGHLQIVGQWRSDTWR